MTFMTQNSYYHLITLWVSFVLYVEINFVWFPWNCPCARSSSTSTSVCTSGMVCHIHPLNYLCLLVGDNAIGQLPPEIVENLSNIRQLQLFKNKVNLVPSEVGQLKGVWFTCICIVVSIYMIRFISIYREQKW